MLPYLQLQAGYLLASGILSAICFALASLAIRSLVLVRYFAAMALVGFGSVALVLVIRVLLPSLRPSLFSIVALVFYAAVLWLPALGFFATRKSRRPGVLTVTLTRVFALASVAIGIVSLTIEPNRLGQRTEQIALPAWSESATPLRIAHISDLQTVGVCEREREAARLVNESQPDFIVFTGDYIAGPFWDTGPAIAAARQFLSELKPRIATIVVMGHSEGERARHEIFEGLDLVYLVNEVHREVLPDGRSVSFHGVHSHDHDLSTLHQPREPNEIRIVVSHVPGISPELTGLDVDLHLAGHTHGGQIVIPGFGAPITLSRLPRKYARGLFRYEDHWLNITAGIGMEGGAAPRIRLFCPPEVSFLEVRGRSADDSNSE